MNGDRARSPELRPDRDEFPLRVEDLYPIVAPIGNEEPALAIERDVMRIAEQTALGRRRVHAAANLHLELPVFCKPGQAVIAAAKTNMPVYLRFGRSATPTFTTPETPFEIGKAYIMREGKDCAIIGCGMLLYNALVAAEELSKKGIECEVINSHTIKPLDGEIILASVIKTGAVVSVEEHQVTGGLGSAIAEVLAKNHPVPQEFIGVQDRFGESGTPKELIEAFGVGVGSIKEAVRKVLKRKQ